MKEVGEFVLGQRSNATHHIQNTVKLVLKDKINWPGGKAPRDSPICGFEGELCPEKAKAKEENGNYFGLIKQ